MNILLTVNSQDALLKIRGKEVVCRKGESIKSIRTWAKEFNWSVSKVRRFFKVIEKDGMIKLESLGFTTRLTVLNYNKYQGDLPEAPNDSEADTPKVSLNNNKTNSYNDEIKNQTHQQTSKKRI